jgi:hypothetical protein
VHPIENTARLKRGKPKNQEETSGAGQDRDECCDGKSLGISFHEGNLGIDISDGGTWSVFSFEGDLP